MRLTKIICTIGPATRSEEGIRMLAERGMNVARINFSHGSQEQHGVTIDTILKLNKEGLNIAMLLDTKGAEIRTGDLAEPLLITKGQEIVFSPHPVPDEKRPVIHVNYEGFSEDVLETDRILLDNGEMTFELISVNKDGSVLTRAKDDGKIGSRRHINLPGANIALPSITESDWSDIKFGSEKGMDFVALSFIRTAEEVADVRKFLTDLGSSMRIIAKIETRQAIDNIEDIIDVSDGIMVARGDLGAEIPFERIPAHQDMIVEKCRHARKPVIVATHMLESMINHPMPTRAEVTDVAHAAMTRADATMLSGETAAGKYPFAAIEAMDRILQETESHLAPFNMEQTVYSEHAHEARAEAAVTMALSLGAPAIVVLTRTGKTALAMSKFRPRIPIIACTDSPVIQRALQLSYGVKPLLTSFEKDPEGTVDGVLAAITSLKLVESGQQIVLVSDVKVREGVVSTVHIRHVP